MGALLGHTASACAGRAHMPAAGAGDAALGFNDHEATGVRRRKGKKDAPRAGLCARCAAAVKPPLCCLLCLLTCQISPAWSCLQTPPLPCQLRWLTASSQHHLVAEKEVRRWKLNCQSSPPGYLQASLEVPEVMAWLWWCLLHT